MIGKYQLQIGADQIISGMASSDFATDGAIGVSSHDINPFVKAGTIYSTVVPTDKSTNLADNIIATAEDGTGNLNNRIGVGDAANYYTFASDGTVTKKVTGSATTKYKYGRTDIGNLMGASGNPFAFVSILDNISLWASNLGSITETWWSTVAYYTGTTHPPALSSSAPHPLLNFEGFLWVADGSQMHNIIPNTAAATPTVCVNLSVLSLELTDTIYALGIDPATGLMLISFQTTTNQGNVLSSQYFIGLYDGYSAQLRRKIQVDDLVTSFQNVGGTVFCSYGQRLGYFNGNGITFLRKYLNVTNSLALLNYKSHITNVGNILLVADGSMLLAFGEAVGGKKAFFPLARNSPSGSVTNIGAVFPLGNNVIAMASSTSLLQVFDMSDSAAHAGNGVLALNNIYFPRPVYIRRIRIITTGIPHVSGGGEPLLFSFVDEKNNVFATQGNGVYNPPSGSTYYVADFDYTSAKVQGIQPLLDIFLCSIGIIRFIIYYDIAE